MGWGGLTSSHLSSCKRKGKTSRDQKGKRKAARHRILPKSHYNTGCAYARATRNETISRLGTCRSHPPTSDEERGSRDSEVYQTVEAIRIHSEMSYQGRWASLAVPPPHWQHCQVDVFTWRSGIAKRIVRKAFQEVPKLLPDRCWIEQTRIKEIIRSPLQMFFD